MTTFTTIVITILLIITGYYTATLAFPPASSSPHRIEHPQYTLTPHEMQDLIQDFPHTDPLPTLFISHAAPVLLMKPEDGFAGNKNDYHPQSEVANWYRSVPTKLGLVGDQKPTAVVQFSAHYESESLNTIEILCQDDYKGLFYDYYGFPDYTYDFKYPAPGHVKLATYIQQLLQEAMPTMKFVLNKDRKLDHGTSIPFSFMYPEADIPIIQLSVINDAKMMRKLGEVLAPLRTRGVLIGGNGQLTHNMGMLFGRVSQQMVDDQSHWLETLTSGMKNDDTLTPEQNYAKRSAAVDNWNKVKGWNIAHPRFEHYIPLPPVVGMTKGFEKDKMFVVGDYWLMERHSLRSVAWAESLPFVDTKKAQQTTAGSKDEL